jgi:hypothetical protein
MTPTQWATARKKIEKTGTNPEGETYTTGTPTSLRFLWTWANFVKNGERMPKGTKYA